MESRVPHILKEKKKSNIIPKTNMHSIGEVESAKSLAWNPTSLSLSVFYCLNCQKQHPLASASRLSRKRLTDRSSCHGRREHARVDSFLRGFASLLGQFGGAAGEGRAQAAGVDGAFRAVTAVYVWGASELRGSERGSEDAYAEGRDVSVRLGEKLGGGRERVGLEVERKRGEEEGVPYRRRCREGGGS